LAFFYDLLWGNVLIAEVDEKLESWDLGEVFFIEAESWHPIHLSSFHLLRE